MSAELSAQIPSDYAVSLIAQTNIDTITANQTLENETLYHLVRGDVAPTIINNYLSSNGTIYTSTNASGFSLTSNPYTVDELSKCELLTTPGEHDGTFAVSTYHYSADSNIQPDSTTVDVGTDTCAYNKEYNVTTETSALYDSYISLNLTSNNGPFYVNGNASGSRFNALFTDSSSYSSVHHYQKALNSKYANISHANYLSVIEDSSFNSLYALGNSLNSYFTVDTSSNSDGKRIIHNIQGPYTLVGNNFTLETNASNVHLLQESDFGTYRVQQFPEPVHTTVMAGSATLADTVVQEFPITSTERLNVTNLHGIDYLPRYTSDTLTDTEFYTFFDANDVSYPLPGYKFQLIIDTSNNSGFSFVNDDWSSTSKQNDLVTIQDNGLYNNVELMKNWIDSSCALVFTNGSVFINSSGSNVAYMQLDTGREALDQSLIDTDGEIKINNGTPTTRANIEDNNTTLTPKVFYQSDNAQQALKPIDEIYKTSYQNDTLSQLVFKKPINNTHFLQSGNSALNFISDNTIVNNNFNVANWEYVSSESAQSGNLSLFKILPSHRLDSVDFLIDSSGNRVSGVYSNIYLENLKIPVQDEFKGRALFTVKELSDLTFSSMFTSASGWSLSTPQNNKMFSNSNNAYSSDGVFWPNLSDVNNLHSGTINDIKVRFTFGIGNPTSSTSSPNNSDFNDNVKIEWGETTSYGKEMYISQVNFTRNTILPTTKTITTINNISMQTGILQNKSILLQKHETRKYYSVSFNLNLRPYNNIICTSPVYTVDTVHYTIKDLKTNTYYPSSFLSNIIYNDTTPYVNITETIVSGETTVSFTLTKNDICELNTSIQIIGDASGYDQWTNITDIYKNISIFYSNQPTILNINNNYEVTYNDSDVQMLLQYQYLNEDSGSEENLLILNDPDGYTINLSNNQSKLDVDYVLFYKNIVNADIGEGVNSSIGNKSPTTNLVADTIVDPINGYNTVNNWQSGSQSTYYLSIDTEDVGLTSNSKTVLNIKDGNGTTLHTIKVSNNYFFGTPIYIATAMEDIWRVNYTVNTILNQLFKSTVYDETNYLNDSNQYQGENPSQLNVFAITNGVYLTSDNTIDFDTVQVGSYIKYSLLPDLVAVNLVGTAGALSAFTENGLAFKYESGSGDSYYYSKTLSFNYYRGYRTESGSSDGVVQTYAISRSKATAEFKFFNSTGKYYQTVDVYKTLTGVDLRDMLLDGVATNNNNDDLGHQMLKFHYSILADSDTTYYPIYTKGDDVTINITNPKVNNYSLTLNSSLKTFNIYTFSGLNNDITPTGGTLKIRSTRLRFNSIVLTGSIDSNVSPKIYEMGINEGILAVYKISQQVGNPLLQGDSATNLDVALAPDASWGNIMESFSTYEQTVAGKYIANGVFKLSRNSGATSTKTISFFVVHKPMLKFTTLANRLTPVCPDNMPLLQSDTDYISNNLLHYYLPVVTNQTYNPFAQSVVIPITGNNSTITHTHSATQVNNITFTQNTTKTYYEYLTSPLLTRYEIVVEGTNATITLNTGLSDTSGNIPITIYTLLNNTPLSYFLDNTYSDTNVSVTSINNGTGVKIGLLQITNPSPYIGSVDTIMGVSSPSPNIYFNIPYFFLPSSTAIINLDLPTGPGTTMKMYTRNIINDNGTYKIALYKYDAFGNVDPTSIDWNNNDNYATNTAVNVKFHNRYKKTINIPQRTLQDNTIETLRDLLGKVSYNDIAQESWSHDETYANPSTSPFFSFCSLTKNAMRSTLPKFFSPPNVNGHQKMNIVTRNKILLIKDKLGNTVCELDHDGIFKAPFISGNSYAVHYTINSIAPIDADDIRKRSTLGFARQI